MHEDGNEYIIFASNTGNINTDIWLPISTDSIQIERDGDNRYFAYWDDGGYFTGDLLSNDGRVWLEFKESELNAIRVFHDDNTNVVLVEENIRDDKEDEEEEEEDNCPSYWDINDNEISEERFESRYGKSIAQVIYKAVGELKNYSILNEDESDHESHATYAPFITKCLSGRPLTSKFLFSDNKHKI